jgi:hypothetical protein
MPTTSRHHRAWLLAALAVASLLPPIAAGAQPAGIRVEKGSGLEVRFVAYPWRPDIFQGFEEGAPAARSWAFARLVVSSYYAFDGVRLEPGHYAMVLNPKTGSLPMTLELRRIGGGEFLAEVPERAAAPPGATVYKRPVTFGTGAEPTPSLDLTIASWDRGSVVTVRYGNRKLAKELPRTGF